MVSERFSKPARSSFLRASAVALAAAAMAVSAPALADNGEWFPPQAGEPAQQPPLPADDGAQPAPGSDEYADNDPSALTDFQEPLAPYGEWADDPTYGTVWIPDSAQVGPDFAPYQTAGQWGVTGTGDWMWQSDYAWGYIPFHYGRWVWTGGAWGWIPGRRYSPAWVAWRTGQSGYVGWGPLPPTHRWVGGRSVRLGTVPRAAFCFVPNDYAFFRGVSTYVVRDRGMVQAVAGATQPFHPGAGRMSPTLSEAHIPSSAAPRATAHADARSMAYATHGSTAAVRQGRTYDTRSSFRGSSYDVGSYTGDRGRASSAGLRTPGASRFSGSAMHGATHSGSPSYARGPHYAAPAVSHPAYRPSSSTSAHTSTVSHASGGGRRR